MLVKPMQVTEPDVREYAAWLHFRMIAKGCNGEDFAAQIGIKPEMLQRALWGIWLPDILTRAAIESPEILGPYDQQLGKDLLKFNRWLVEQSEVAQQTSVAVLPQPFPIPGQEQDLASVAAPDAS